MARRKKVEEISTTPRKRPALTPEGREEQMISLAYDLVERRLREGTATSQETTHFLKLGSIKGRAELEKLRRENAVLEEKRKAYERSENGEEFYAQAIEAMKQYSGASSDE